MVVDDEQDVCTMLTKFLTMKGYETSCAFSGEEAIKKVKEERPHCILLDIGMPKMDGLETLKRIRKVNKGIGIVIITGIEDDAVGRKCIALGANDYITKPLDLAYLETVLIVQLVDSG